MGNSITGGKSGQAVKRFPQAVGSDLPLALTALLLIYSVLKFPLIHFGVHGKTHAFFLWADAGTQDLGWLALLVWCAVGATLFMSVCLAGRALLPPQRNEIHTTLPQLLRFVSMWEAPIVLLLAVAVGVLSLADLGTTQLGSGFYSLLGLSLVIAITRKSRLTKSTSGIASQEIIPNQTAHYQNLSVVWALILTSLLLYLPAMLCPIATFTFYGGSETRTILGGVASLFEEGKPLLATIVFIASVAIPLLKLAGLASLLLIVRYNWKSRQETRIRIYRILEKAGRWAHRQCS
jgi:paraquat-inducible protein A